MGSRTTSVAARAALIAAAVATVFAVLAGPALAAKPTLHGTYATPKTQGAITYTAKRAFYGGSEGRFVVGGAGYPGSIYRATNGGLGMVWYYGTSGRMAGNALTTAQPDGRMSGTIWFFSRKGAQTDTGTVSVTIP